MQPDMVKWKRMDERIDWLKDSLSNGLCEWGIIFCYLEKVFSPDMILQPISNADLIRKLTRINNVWMEEGIKD